MLNGFLKNLSFSSKKLPTIEGSNHDINQSIETIKSFLGDSLISCNVSKHGEEESIAQYNSQESIAELFVYLSSHINRKLLDYSFPTINSHYKLELNNNFTILIVFIKDYQFVFVLNTLSTDIDKLLKIYIPQIREKLITVL
jgi:hypothetical protein